MNIMQATFVVDPPTMFTMSVLIGLFSLLTRPGKRLDMGAFQRRRRIITVLSTLFMLGFWAFAEVPCYYDWVDPPGFSGMKTCNEFMWRGYGLSMPFIDPPIPSHGEWWSTLWLVAMLGLQWACLREGLSFIYQNMFFANPENWSRPKRRTHPKDR